MQCNIRSISTFRLIVISVSFVGTLFFIGCGKKATETPTVTKGPVESQVTQSTQDAAKPEPNIEDKLVKRQMELYNKMSEHYERAPDSASLQQEKPALKVLEVEFEELLRELNGRPLEAQKAARAAVADEWEKTLNRYKYARAMSLLGSLNKGKSQQ